MSVGPDCIDVDDVEIPCIIGCYEEERHTRQPLLVSLRFALDTRRAAHDEALNLSVDYARVMGLVRFLLHHGRFQLLETAAEVVAAAILSSVTVVDDVTICLRKPRALGGNGVPSLKITRHRDSAASLWTFPFGVVDVVWNVNGLGIYRVQLRPGGRATLPQDVEVYAADAERTGVALGLCRGLHNASSSAAGYVLVARPPLRLDGFAVG